jgi:hypothetical protein
MSDDEGVSLEVGRRDGVFLLSNLLLSWYVILDF